VHKLKATQIDHTKSVKESKKIIDDKIKAYRAAQKKQILSGGPGPVADFDILKIVNEFDGKYEIEDNLPKDPGPLPEVSTP
jgi:hypothetical protein